MDFSQISILLILLLIIFIPTILPVLLYNRMVSLRNRVDNAWSQIDVQLRRRFDLIPNLVETVKGYAAHEKETLEMVTKARAQMAGRGGVAEQAQANNMLTQALKTLFAVVENYPDLKANENFMMLQEELAGTESKIAYARQFYNDNVMAYNTLIQSFPSNILARTFGFAPREYFEIEEAPREPIKVEF